MINTHVKISSKYQSGTTQHNIFMEMVVVSSEKKKKK